MANLLVWILVFAGATLGLLAIFLIAAERELRAQLDESADSGANPMPKIAFVSPPSAGGETLPAAVEKIKTGNTGRAEREADGEALQRPPDSGETPQTELITIRREIAEQIRLNTLRLGEGLFELERPPDSANGRPLGESLLNEPAARQGPRLAPHGAGERGGHNQARRVIPLTPSMAVIVSEPKSSRQRG